MKIFKYKSVVKVPIKENPSDYLSYESVKAVGAVNFDEKERLLISQNGDKYAIFKIEYLNQNGIDIEIDVENQKKVNELLKAMIHPFKIIEMNAIKNGLIENIRVLVDVLKNNKLSTKRREKVFERIDVMKFYNEEKYITLYFYVSLLDLDIFIKLAPNVFNIKRLNQNETMNVLKSLNNDME